MCWSILHTVHDEHDPPDVFVFAPPLTAAAVQMITIVLLGLVCFDLALEAFEHYLHHHKRRFHKRLFDKVLYGAVLCCVALHCAARYRTILVVFVLMFVLSPSRSSTDGELRSELEV